MPSLTHEVLVRMFQANPGLARALLRGLRVELPEGDEETGSDDLSQIAPVAYSADAVVRVRAADGTWRAAVVIEVQLSRDDDKQLTWPAYVANARRQHRCPCVLLVVCPDRRVARWAEEPIELGPGSLVTPHVVSPDSLAALSETEAGQLPELLAMRALLRPKDEAAVWSGMAALPRLASEVRHRYFDLMLAALPAALRSAVLEQMMRNPQFQSDFARKYEEAGFVRGRDEGVKQGVKQGVQQGVQQGRLKEARAALFRVLARRGLAVPPEGRRRIEGESDLGQLERWLDAAVTAANLEDVLGAA